MSTAHTEIAAVAPRIQLVADGAATRFDYPFLIFERDDLEVYVQENRHLDGYDVSGTGSDQGGSVTFETAPQKDAVVTLRRKLVVKRTSDFQEGGALRADALNAELDYQTATLQDLEAEQTRSLRFHPAHPEADAALPAAEAGKALIWNGAADGLENGPDADDLIRAEAHADVAAGAAISAAGHADRAETALTGFYETAAAPALEIDFANEEARRDEDERKRPTSLVDGIVRTVDLRESGQVFFVTKGGGIALPNVSEAGVGFRVAVVKEEADGEVQVSVDGGDVIRDVGRLSGASVRVLQARGERVDFLCDGAVWLAESGGRNAGPLFRAFRTQRQVLAVGADTVVDWDQIIDDSHGLWDVGQSALVGVPPGKYMLTLRLYLAMTDLDMELRTFVERKAGDTWYRHRDHVTWIPDKAGRFWTVSFSAIVSSGDGSSDMFRIVLRHDDPAPREIAASDLHSAIEFVRVAL